MKTQTKLSQDNLTPKDALSILVKGNQRFIQNLKLQRNVIEQVLETSSGQYPFAVIHSCIDSRVPVELVFDQGFGDVFSTRVAGNIINEDVLGSMEYGCKVAGAKIVVVMAHTKCGAVTAACNHVELGNVTALLEKIKPSVAKVQPSSDVMNESEIERVAILNVEHSIQRIKSESKILNDMEEMGEIKIVGAVYSVETGGVDFL